MKIPFRLIFLFLIILTHISCSKKNETDIAAELIKGSWRWTATELVDINGKHLPNGPEACELDNTYTFSANGTWTQDLGTILCDNGQQNETLPYSYDKTTGKLTIGNIRLESVNISGNILRYSQPVAYVTQYKELVFIYKRR
jgi:hypothetical protein